MQRPYIIKPAAMSVLSLFINGPTCFWATICMCWWTRASSSLPEDKKTNINFTSSSIFWCGPQPPFSLLLNIFFSYPLPCSGASRGASWCFRPLRSASASGCQSSSPAPDDAMVRSQIESIYRHMISSFYRLWLTAGNFWNSVLGWDVLFTVLESIRLPRCLGSTLSGSEKGEMKQGIQEEFSSRLGIDEGKIKRHLCAFVQRFHIIALGFQLLHLILTVTLTWIWF